MHLLLNLLDVLLFGAPINLAPFGKLAADCFNFRQFQNRPARINQLFQMF